MFDSLKELLIAKTLSKFRYVTSIIWTVIGAALSPIFVVIELNKSKSDISCDAKFNDRDEKEGVLEECFDEYQKEYTRFPVYGFVLINFFVIAIVPIIYSQFVKSKVNALETQQPDVEGQQGNLAVRKGLFTAYCCQLAAIIALAILSIILLQTQVFRPSINFPSNFICDLSKKGSNSSPLSSANASLTNTDTYPCRNSRATDKFGGSVALTVFNGICAFLAFIELVWILWRARNSIQFMQDFQFYVDHLRSSGDEAALPLTTPDPRTEVEEQLERLKDCIKEGTEQLHDLKQPIRPNLGEGPEPKDLELDKIFVKLLLHDGRAGYDFPKDRREQLKVFPKPKSEDSNYVSMQGIIDGHNKHVLLVGRPGIGKTILSTKLLRESAFNKFESQNFDAAFLVKFKRFKSRTNLNLRELLSRSETVRNLDDKVWNYIIENPSKVLLIFDGVDEFNDKKEISNDDLGFPDSEGKEMPLHCLYKKIASGKLLKGATVITTSRATAVPCLNMLTGVKVLEILGFTPEDIEVYVGRFTNGEQNPEVKKNIWQHISSNINLLTLCYVPMNCFIICSSLSWFCSRSLKLPTKLTKIYSIALKIFHFKHGRKCHTESHGDLNDLILKPLHELPPICKKQFQELGKIAFEGLEDERLQFSSTEVKGLEDSGLLHRLRDRQGPTSEDPNEPEYCFIHLTFQEFLAAYYVVNTKTETNALQEFIAGHINHGSWNVVVQFLAGLLADADEAKQLQSGKIFSELLPTSTAKKKMAQLLRDAQPMMTETATPCIQWPKRKSEKNLAITVFKCLYELDAKQQSLIKGKLKKIAFNEVNFSLCQLAPADCAAILHLLKNVDKKFGLILRANFLGDLGCMEIQKWTDEIKCNGGDCNLKGLDFGGNSPAEKGAKYLCDALKNVKRNLTELILDNNCLRDTGVELLSGVLKDEECELTTLNLQNNEIGAKGVQHLRDALKDNEHNKLTVLNLAANNIGEEGAKHLSDALKDENCKLTVLNLRYDWLGEKGVEHVSDALKNVNCKLTVLNLTGTNLGEKGVEHLSDALKDENRKLLPNLSLSLRENSISDKGAKHLSDALKDVNCNLTELDLGLNDVGVKGAGHLSDALKDGKCKLTVLRLDKNNIKDEGAKHLRDALTDVNFKLTKLNLAENNIGDEGVEQLRNAHKSCKLITEPWKHQYRRQRSGTLEGST